MRLLVFEFITGGGLLDQPLPSSLLQEGYLMRNALLADLSELAAGYIELLVLHDARIVESVENNSESFRWIAINSGTDLKTKLLGLDTAYDAVWLIAPETDGILLDWCRFFNDQGKRLCTSADDAVSICADKLQTFKVLQGAGISCVPSCEFIASKPIEKGEWVLKKNNSVGCDEVYFLSSEPHWSHVLSRLNSASRYLVQPYIHGKALSLSCLFYRGSAYFICCNEQHLQVVNQQFVLSACTVNVQIENVQSYQSLCQTIAEAIPQLFGYVGIDFIETALGEHFILEINPRLTSSYAGIKTALGINVAAQVLNMLDEQTPRFIKTNNQQIPINMNQGIINVG